MSYVRTQVLFPDSYAATSAWLRGLLDPAEDALFAAQQRLLAALDSCPDFGRLAGGLLVKARTKSLFSVMKKLLHLGDMARGGRSREVRRSGGGAMREWRGNDLATDTDPATYAKTMYGKRGLGWDIGRAAVAGLSWRRYVVREGAGCGVWGGGVR